MAYEKIAFSASPTGVATIALNEPDTRNALSDDLLAELIRALEACRDDDAVRCVDAGAAAVVVSNHGARQLADAPATADILAEVVDAVSGRAEVYVDGGVRRAPDVVKALAMGRPPRRQ